ncbi:MAG: 2-amino-4-hydroxy-6-hydroxymethyldihydropteridine diphosphokinase [Desulfobacula sp.]|nr:2-amino-4-hydroxy-6-hydroxymethyldihydropteridine diphosphokinase [Desulfobacula sp.]
MKPALKRVFLSIGSNVGDKKQNLDQAVSLLQNHDHITVTSVSSYYQTEPQNYMDQDWFVNAAVRLDTTLEPMELLDALKQLETDLDKEGKPFRFGPRIIDLDIIYFSDAVFKTQRLEIPHPRMHERCFVLIPLCDIGADTIHPTLNLTTEELLDRIEEQETQKVILLDKEA